MRKLVIAIVSAAICFQPAISVRANSRSETAEDLFKLYDKSETIDYDGINEEYLEAKKSYESLNKTVKDLESFNNMYDSAETFIKEKKRTIDKEIKEVMQANNDIASKIENAVTGDFVSLLELDTEYKTNVERINQLLEDQNKYALTEKKKISYKKLGKLKGKMASLKKEYEKAEDEPALGSVYQLKYPLGKQTHITSKFGNRLDPITNKNIRFHAGVDFHADMNTEVLSLFNGTVVGTGYGPLGGYFVRIDHGDGVVSYYCHLNEIKCVVGQKVKQYDVVALSGNSGLRTTAPHLHLGVYIKGNAVDPEVLFAGGDSK